MSEPTEIIFSPFSYAEETSGNWAEHLNKKAKEGHRGISSYLLWGAHEQFQGTRDFSRSSRLRLEKFLRLVQEAGLELELKLGFPPSSESIPAWAKGEGYLQTVLPTGAWTAECRTPTLTRVPSLFDADLLQSFLDFLDEAVNLCALYMKPEGPISRITVDLGVYENDLSAIEAPSYIEKLQQRYPTIDPFNTQYQSTFKDFLAATSVQGTRAVFDKRPWLAAYDYKWCRAKMLAEVAERVATLPSLAPIRSFLNFKLDPAARPEPCGEWEIAIDPVLIEVGASQECYPFTPAGLVHPQALAAFRLWEYLRERATFDGIATHLLPPAPGVLRFQSPVLAIIAGKYLSRAAYRLIDERVSHGGQVFFPLDFPQYDENMGSLDWGAPTDRVQVKSGRRAFTQIKRGRGRVWIPGSVAALKQDLWDEVAQMSAAILKPDVA